MLELWKSEEIADDEALRAWRPPPLSRAALAWLDDTDRAIVELAEQGVTYRVIGRAVGRNAGSVCRRLSLIRRRARAPLVQVLLSPRSPIPEDSRKITLLNQLAGRTPQQIARTLNLTDHAVREHIRYATGLVHGLLRRPFV